MLKYLTENGLHAQQAAGRFHIDLFRLPQLSDCGFLLLRRDGGGGHSWI